MFFLCLERERRKLVLLVVLRLILLTLLLTLLLVLLLLILLLLTLLLGITFCLILNESLEVLSLPARIICRPASRTSGDRGARG